MITYNSICNQINAIQEQIDSYHGTDDQIVDVYVLSELEGELEILEAIRDNEIIESDNDGYKLDKKYWNVLEHGDVIYWYEQDKRRYIPREVMSSNENKIVLAPMQAYGSQDLIHPDEVIVNEETYQEIRERDWRD